MPDVLVHEVDKEQEAAAYAEATLGVAREQTKRLVIKIAAVVATIFSCVACFFLYALSAAR